MGQSERVLYSLEVTVDDSRQFKHHENNEKNNYVMVQIKLGIFVQPRLIKELLNRYMVRCRILNTQFCLK